MPTTYTSLTIGARTKKVKDYFGARRDAEGHGEPHRRGVGREALRLHRRPAIREMQKSGWRATGPDAESWMSARSTRGDAEVVGALLAAGCQREGRRRERRHAGDARRGSRQRRDRSRLLLAAGADPTARDGAGRNAADRARDGMAAGPASEQFVDMILRLLDRRNDASCAVLRSFRCCWRMTTVAARPHRRHGRLDDRRHAGVQVAARGAAERQRRRDEPVRLLADEGASRTGRSSTRAINAQRSDVDRGALRRGRHREEAGRGGDHRRRERRLPGTCRRST